MLLLHFDSCFPAEPVSASSHHSLPPPAPQENLPGKVTRTFMGPMPFLLPNHSVSLTREISHSLHPLSTTAGCLREWHCSVTLCQLTDGSIPRLLNCSTRHNMPSLDSLLYFVHSINMYRFTYLTQLHFKETVRVTPLR